MFICVNYTIQPSGVRGLGLERGWGKALGGVLGVGRGKRVGEREGGGGESRKEGGRGHSARTDRTSNTASSMAGGWSPPPTPGSFFQKCTGLMLGPFQPVAFPQKDSESVHHVSRLRSSVWPVGGPVLTKPSSTRS